MKTSGARRPLAIFLTLAIAWLFFSTPAEAFRFAFFADSRNCPGPPNIDEKALKDILQQMKKVNDEEKKNPIEFIIFGGDMACRGGTENLEYWKEYVTQYLPSAKVILFVTKGNHELYGPKKTDAVRRELDNEYQEVFPPPTPWTHPFPFDSAAYSFEYGANNTCLFVVLDTYEDLTDQAVRAYISPQQMDWLSGELAKKPKDHPDKSSFFHKFVFGHCPVKPLSTQENHGWEYFSGTNTELAKALQKGGVRAYFCGHDHTYRDWSPLQDKGQNYGFKQLIVGNGGANTTQKWNFEVVDVVSPQQVKYTSYLGNAGNYTKKTVVENY